MPNAPMNTKTKKCTAAANRQASFKQTRWSGFSHRALIRYSARLMLAWEPVMVTCLSVEPSTGFAILIWAPDIWRISLIFAPWRPMMQPMSWENEGRGSLVRKWGFYEYKWKKKKSALHRLEWSARESQFVRRHPSQLKDWKETPWEWITKIEQWHSCFQQAHIPWKPWLLCAMGKGLCCMASWWSLVSC